MKNLIKNNLEEFNLYRAHEYAGIYLHIPFCEHKCGYCDFYSANNFNRYHESFVKALHKEILEYPKLNNICIDSIFFGGGTPSLLSSNDFSSLLSALNSKFKISSHCEITIEANPGTIEFQKMYEYKQLGINRISLGVQSFDNKELLLMERIHDERDIMIALDSAVQCGIDNLSIDLIFALPNQSLANWESNIKKAISCPLTHISAYSLIFEPNTLFHTKKMTGDLSECSEELERQMMELSNDLLESAGFHCYEISNFAKEKQYQSVHNLKYWQMKPYFSFGPSAHSYNGWNLRWWNIRSTEKYIQQVLSGNSIITNMERLTDGDSVKEWLLCQLRLKDGLNLDAFRRRFNFRFELSRVSEIKSLIDMNCLELDSTYLRCTQNGFYYLNEIIRMLTK